MSEDLNLITIKKIKTSAGEHDIDAKYLGGYTFEQIRGMVQGVAGTYVIETSKSSENGYDDVVKSTSNTVTTTKSILNTLTGTTESYKLGDIILMEEVSDGVKVFDRWVSLVDDDNITLAVLETQVALHHHEVSSSKSTAITGVTPTSTTNTMATVGNNVDVVSSGAGSVVTSVSFDDTAGYDLEISVGTETDGVGHSHTVESHDHSVSIIPSDFVTETASAYTTLTTSTYTPHTHTTVNVAGVQSDSTDITYVTGGETETFIKSLTDSEQTTGNTVLTTGANADGLNTNAQSSTDVIGDVVKTTESGSHNHNVTLTTDSDVVTDITLASTVITDVTLDYTAPTVAEKVITDVTPTLVEVVSTIDTTDIGVTTGWVVDDAGVLSLTSGTAVKEVSESVTEVVESFVATETSQTAGTAKIEKSSANQNSTKSTVTSTGTTETAGAHTHGFSHTHSIPSHTHSIAEHNHTYVKAVSNETGSAYKSLSTASYTPHTHNNATVVGSIVDGDVFTYVTGGTTTDVVRSLSSETKSFTTSSVTAATDTKYYKISGDIDFPGLNVVSSDISTMLTTTTITPAVDSGETPIASITTTSTEFVNGVNVKTSTNIGGSAQVNNE